MTETTPRSTGSRSLQAVLLVGATGEYSFGQFVLRELIKSRQSFSRIGVYLDLSRDNATKTPLLNQLKQAGIEVVSGTGFESPEPFKGFDCIMSFLGNHGLHLQPLLIDSAIAAGARHIYPSEYGADLLVGQNWTQRYYVEKVKTRRHLEERGKDLPELGWTYVLVGRLTEWAVTSHFGFDNRAARARIYGTPEGKQSLINATDAAAYTVQTLLDPLKDGGRRTYRFSESSPTYATLFNTIAAVTGKEYQVEYLDVEAAQVEEEAAKQSGDIDAELSASHKLIQGRQGTLLPLPWDNKEFPGVSPSSLYDSLKAAFASPKLRKAYGLH
ncbi:uncharacterized protein AB675_6615 [Cyphellophora attinorum]|uniref:NmrA-like domain-containing protein n=1 Tax=Cyphellophora attinorum TaxID=1664694 RepID=A0A0N1HZ55_9EURO|nr:uncharacterized protein AB675_6615 [Phialophora attinorum]KPI43974.1 hypothetical protein AB675_6615 [Phialophora attinorum]